VTRPGSVSQTVWLRQYFGRAQGLQRRPSGRTGSSGRIDTASQRRLECADPGTSQKRFWGIRFTQLRRRQSLSGNPTRDSQGGLDARRRFERCSSSSRSIRLLTSSSNFLRLVVSWPRRIGPLCGSLREFCTRCDPHNGPRRAERAKRFWQPAKGSEGISRAEPMVASERPGCQWRCP
jgi:hypothetical protein